MKKIMLCIGVCLMAQASQAQTFDEWFRQKKTQKKYLSQQIAALQVYLDYAKKGYEIAGKAVNAIHAIKQGDFNLHHAFFTSLLQVNPTIKNGAKVPVIIAQQEMMIRDVKQTVQDLIASKQFTREEIGYCTSVLDVVLEESKNAVHELLHVLTAGKLQMRDDERLRRMERIYADMQDTYAFCYSFREDIRFLSYQRHGNQIEINRSRLLNGLK